MAPIVRPAAPQPPRDIRELLISPPMPPLRVQVAFEMLTYCHRQESGCGTHIPVPRDLVPFEDRARNVSLELITNYINGELFHREQMVEDMQDVVAGVAAQFDEEDEEDEYDEDDEGEDEFGQFFCCVGCV